MPIVVSNKQRVYFTMEGERGAFLILHHGLFGSHQDWRHASYVEALADDFRLILPDARGHGRSDRPVEKECYRLSQFADDLVAIMDELDIRNAHFVGYSLGALVGFDLLTRHPERVRLIMLGGEAPAVAEEARAQWRRWAEQIRAEGFAPWAGAQALAGRPARDHAAEDAAEREAAIALLEAMAEWEVSTAEQYQVSSPITIFSATEDPAFERTQRLARKFQRARFIPFPGRTHRGLFEDKSTLLESMLRFIKIARRPPEGGQSAERRERSAGEAVPEPREGAAGFGGQPHLARPWPEERAASPRRGPRWPGGSAEGGQSGSGQPGPAHAAESPGSNPEASPGQAQANGSRSGTEPEAEPPPQPELPNRGGGLEEAARPGAEAEGAKETRQSEEENPASQPEQPVSGER
jgi:pimeloyl-ACP methyl ester carboxylesterase